MSYRLTMKYRIHHILKLATILLCFATSVEVVAQYDPAFTHFWMMETQYNPAAAGSTEDLRVTGVYNAQLAGYEDAPRTMYVGADMPLFLVGPQHGVGLYFMNDQAGIFSLKNFAVQYAHHFNLLGGRITPGVQIDLLNETVDGSKLDLEETNDYAFSSGSVNGSKFDFSAGLRFEKGDLYAAISAKHLMAPKILLGETNEIDIKRSYYFTAGYNIKLKNPLFSIHPNVFCMYDGVDYKSYIHGRLQYENDDKMLFGGLSYSPSHSASLIVGGKFHGVVLSYSYEAFTSGVGVGNGNHEILLNYQTQLNLYKKGKNRHKSVRLL